jgi:hypothetical protein
MTGRNVETQRFFSPGHFRTHQRSKTSSLLDHVASAGEQRGRDLDPKGI